MTKHSAPIFISYARKDLNEIAPILTFLKSHGYSLWIDKEGISGATFWRKEIVEAIVSCPLAIFFASAHSCVSMNVAKELAIASEEFKPILPVLLHELKLPQEIRYQVAGLQYIPYYVDHHQGRERMLSTLSRVVGPPAAPAATVLPGSASISAIPEKIYGTRAAKVLSANARIVESLDNIQHRTRFLWLSLCRVDSTMSSCTAEIKQETFEGIKADLEILQGFGHFQFTTHFAYSAVQSKETVLYIRLDNLTSPIVELAKAINERDINPRADWDIDPYELGDFEE